MDFASAACAPWVSKNSDSFMQRIISAPLIGVNSPARISFRSALLNNRRMKTIEETYRARLQMLVDEAGFIGITIWAGFGDAFFGTVAR